MRNTVATIQSTDDDSPRDENPHMSRSPHDLPDLFDNASGLPGIGLGLELAYPIHDLIILHFKLVSETFVVADAIES
jgi:hypothetical protein